MNLQAKLFSSFGLIGAIVLLTNAGSYFSAAKLYQSIHLLSRNSVPSLDGLWKISQGQVQIEASERLLLSPTLTAFERQGALERIALASKQIDAGLQQTTQTPINDETEQQLLQQFSRDWEIWKKAHQEFLKIEQEFHQLNVPAAKLREIEQDSRRLQPLPDPEKNAAALTLYLRLEDSRTIKETYDRRINASLTQLLQNNQKFAAEIQASSEQAVQQNQIQSLILTTAGLAASLTLAGLLSRAIARPIDKNIQKMLRELEEARDTLECRVEQRTQELQLALQSLTQTQAQLVQTEKMSSLGHLVAGVAHEINNPVNFIHGNVAYLDEYVTDLLTLLELYQKEYPKGSSTLEAAIEQMDLEFVTQDVPKMLASMRVGTDRIREIVQSLRTFARMDEAELKSVNIHDGIDSTLMILQHRLKATPNRPEIQVIRQYGDLPQVECYAGQLNQVFMNLLANAIDAVEEQIAPENASCPALCPPTEPPKPPCITISTDISSDISHKNQVRITIADNGVGIPEAICDRIFDPFYTTKSVGKGTGLGLSISYQIITEKHGGTLSCESQEGQGTQFTVQIPIEPAKVSVSRF